MPSEKDERVFKPDIKYAEQFLETHKKKRDMWKAIGERNKRQEERARSGGRYIPNPPSGPGVGDDIMFGMSFVHNFLQLFMPWKDD